MSPALCHRNGSASPARLEHLHRARVLAEVVVAARLVGGGQQSALRPFSRTPNQCAMRPFSHAPCARRPPSPAPTQCAKRPFSHAPTQCAMRPFSHAPIKCAVRPFSHAPRGNGVPRLVCLSAAARKLPGDKLRANTALCALPPLRERVSVGGRTPVPGTFCLLRRMEPGLEFVREAAAPTPRTPLRDTSADCTPLCTLFSTSASTPARRVKGGPPAAGSHRP